MDSLLSLEGKVALITGASAGLGRHFAKCFATAGATVAVAARRRDLLDQLVSEITMAGGRGKAITLDVLNPESIALGIAEVVASLGPIDVLVNNSGIVVPAKAVDLAEADWDRILDTNLKGAWMMTKEVSRSMIAADCRGSIINVASILGLRVAGAVASYAASKAGLIQLTKAMALELAQHRIRINALAPGYIETDFNREFFASAPGLAMIQRIPQRRLGRESDLDGPLLLLASDASLYMTGSVIVIDGGHLLSSL